MATYEPQTVYRRTIAINTEELPLFTIKPSVNVESELKKIESLKKTIPAAYEVAVAEIKTHAQSEEKAETLADLKELSEFLDFYGPIVNQAKDAHKELTMKLLLDAKPLEDVKASLGNSTPWLTVQSWAGKFTGIGNDRQFVKWLVPESLGKKINEQIEMNRNKKTS